ncbi:hypothetical protein DICVIV_02567 [Dictyocaulus viviparus]|uniref:Helicase ATP-binding domain-containing protein n=1 Tax=Dictyocaulus viviparus TaxID=29172 RepID=A0A0D8Y531_DICVI|nr:hypothetical protein DICVIV_02567 [Dictyocaulus viviparus]
MVMRFVIVGYYETAQHLMKQMLSSRMLAYCNIYTYMQSFRVQLHTSVLTFSNRHLKRNKAKNPSNIYPPEFRAKLQNWPKLLQAEIDASVSHLKQLREVNGLPALEERGLLIANLQLVSDNLHPITGRMIVLNKTRNSECSKAFRTGKALPVSRTPVTIRDANTLKEIAECVILSTNRFEVKVKVRPSSSSNCVDFGKDYILTLSQSSGALHSVKEFFLKNKLVSCVGIDLLAYAFRAKIMPSIHNDRPLMNLPSDLNESQCRAISAALNKRRPFVTIQGPPGTGKTRVVAEIVKQLYFKKLKTLVCAPSNVAVDKAFAEVKNVFQRNSYKDSSTTQMIVCENTIEDAVTSHDMYSELCDVFGKLNSSTEDVEDSKLKAVANKLKWRIITDSYKDRLVIFCTLTSSTIQRLEQVKWHPDVIIVDEAAQVSEPITWTAIIRAKRCILAGDHAQLPCTILSSVDISSIGVNSNLNHPLIMIDTHLRNKQENQFYKEISSEMSYRNIAEEWLGCLLRFFLSKVIETKYYAALCKIFTGEAKLVLRYLNILKAIGIAEKDIAIITPYYAQAVAIRDMADCEDLSVNTVDSFQGQEREIVIFSMVRCNPGEVIGFLQDERRLNVAITRAKRQFVLIGSARMMQSNRHLRSLLRTIRDIGKVYGPGMMDAFEKEISNFRTLHYEDRNAAHEKRGL